MKQDDKWKGFARYLWNDGQHYTGSWQDNRKNGYGKCVYPDGTIDQGIF
jgi:hypothetical protein